MLACQALRDRAGEIEAAERIVKAGVCGEHIGPLKPEPGVTGYSAGHGYSYGGQFLVREGPSLQTQPPTIMHSHIIERAHR